MQAKLVWLLRRQKEREGNSGIFFPFSPSPSPHHPTGGLKGNPTGNNIKNNNNNDNQLFFFLGLYLSVESYNIWSDYFVCCQSFIFFQLSDSTRVLFLIMMGSKILPLNLQLNCKVHVGADYMYIFHGFLVNIWFNRDSIFFTPFIWYPVKESWNFIWSCWGHLQATHQWDCCLVPDKIEGKHIFIFVWLKSSLGICFYFIFH